MPIHSLTVNNFLRLTHVEIEFTSNGEVTLITGKNGAGKSSLMAAIRAAYGGKRFVPQNAVHDGAKKAEIVLLDDKFFIECSITEGGTFTHRIWEAENGAKGKRYSRPHEILSELYRDIGFDPSEGMRLKPKEQVEMLRKAMGLDLSELDEREAGIFTQRRDVNRDCQAAQAQLDAMPIPAIDPEDGDGTPLADMLDELQEREKHNARLSQAAIRHENAMKDVQRVAADLERLRETLKKVTAEHDAAGTLKPCDELRAKMRDAEEHNEQVRQAKARGVKKAELATLNAEAGRLTGELTALAADRKNIVEDAGMPVEGLAFGDECLMYRGRPLTNASESDQLRVWINIAKRMSPVVLVRNGEKFDTEHRQILAEETQGHQVIMEVATDGENVGVLIEDGTNA